MSDNQGWLTYSEQIRDKRDKYHEKYRSRLVEALTQLLAKEVDTYDPETDEWIVLSTVQDFLDDHDLKRDQLDNFLEWFNDGQDGLAVEIDDDDGMESIVIKPDDDDE